VRKVAFLVLPEFSSLGLAACIEPLFIANWLSQRAVFDWTIVSPDGASVRASNGRITEVDGDLETAAGCETVFVLASFDPRRTLAGRRIVRWFKRLARVGVEIGGIENGSLVLAEAGLLDGHRVAVHWDNALGFHEHYPKSETTTQLFVRSRDRITCAGASAILDMMIAWIGWHADAALAGETADHLLLGRPRAADTAQRAASAGTMASTDAAVLQARAIMSRHIEEPLMCGEIARRVGLSLRQIERRFKGELKSSMLQQYRQIRMAKAHQLLQQTGLSVTEVALSCGFVSPGYFCRLYRSQFGCSPSRDRTQSTTAPVLRRQGPRDV
jgi:AraC family carnitine catabolism transcriptional activator